MGLASSAAPTAASASLYLEAVTFARAHLFSLYGRGVDLIPADFPAGALPRVNVTLRTRGQVRGSMSGAGETFVKQLQSAVERAAKDRRFAGPIVEADLASVSVEVWLQLSSEELSVTERSKENALKLGEDGVELKLGSASAYYKPSVALTSGFSTTSSLLSALCKKAGLKPDDWQREDCSVRKTSWIHLAETSNQSYIVLKALRPQTQPALSREAIARWVCEGSEYLIHNQDADGGFAYIYNPLRGVTMREEANPVRASGCTYALALAASSPLVASREQLISCTRRAVDAILTRCTDLGGDAGCFIRESDDSECGKLGTTALLLAALLSPSLQTAYRKEAELLTAGIKSAQNDLGLFKCNFGADEEGDNQINFFPGQALLALTIKSAAGDESCRSYYRRAFEPYRNHFRKLPATAFVGWHVDVWSRAAILDSNPEFAAFAFEQIDWLLQFQIRRPGLTFGGFDRTGRSQPEAPSIVFTEAIARGAALALQMDDRRFERYREATLAGLEFCSRLRLTEEQAIFLEHPKRAIGGVVKSLSDFHVRSDTVQHLITLALAVLDEPALLGGF